MVESVQYMKSSVFRLLRLECFFLICTLCLLPLEVFSQVVLPQGIWHPRLMFGTVSEVSSEFSDEGKLNNIGRYNQTFDSDFLKNQIPEFGVLCDLLNEYSGSYELCDEINLGSLKFSGSPTISYIAPVIAYGVSSKVTIGVAVPVVSMTGNVSVEQVGSNNANAVRAQIAGSSVQAQFDEAFDKMSNADLVAEFNKALDERGYEPIGERNFSVLGDIQLLTFYEYYQTTYWNNYLQLMFNLPTGPQDDPDDLMDFPNFHQTGFRLKNHHDVRPYRRWTLGFAYSYFWKIQDTTVKRVPENEDDILPDEDRKESVTRDLGDIVTLDIYTKYGLTDFIYVNAGIEMAHKAKDEYSGSNPDWDYDLLERDTEANWIGGKVGLTFTTVDWYKSGRFKMPFMISYNYSDILDGKNVPKQVKHEGSLLLFF